MVRFLVRLVGFLLLAAGFVGMVVDGARSIANDALLLTSTAEFGQKLFPASFRLFEPWARSHLPHFVWDPILTQLLRVPAAPVIFLVGAILLWLGRRPAEPIGFMTGA